MAIRRQLRRILVFVCLAAVVFAAFMHAGTDLPVALVAAFWLVTALAVNPPLRFTEKRNAIHAFPLLPVFSPRPPPIR